MYAIDSLARLVHHKTRRRFTMNGKQKNKLNEKNNITQLPLVDVACGSRLFTYQINRKGIRYFIGLISSLFSISIKSCLMIKNCHKECSKWRNTWNKHFHITWNVKSLWLFESNAIVIYTFLMLMLMMLQKVWSCLMQWNEKMKKLNLDWLNQNNR